MQGTARPSAIVSGICVTLAILLNAGCATTQQTPMGFVDLNHFQIDCRKKAEQMAFLQSMRPTRDEKLLAGLSAIFQPWTYVTDPYGYSNNRALSSGRTDWLTNQLLMELRDNC